MRGFIALLFVFVSATSQPLKATHDGYSHQESQADDVFQTEKSRLLRDDSPLRVDQAFVLTGEKLDENAFLLRWQIADNYYLYKNKFAVYDGDTRIEAQPELSNNDVIHKDAFFGEGLVYYQFTDATLKVTQPPEDIIITYQGCWQGGICYPVQYRRLVAGEPLAFEVVSVEETGAGAIKGTAQEITYDSSNYNYYIQKLRGAAPVWVLLLFLLAGIGLTFTPCVLPMLPIISGIITNAPKGGGKAGGRQRLALALVYALSMAVVFSIMGLLSSWIGYGLRLAIASPAVLVVLAILVSLLGVSLIKPIRLPGSLAVTQRINGLLDTTAGTYTGAALWGGLSPLVVGTCLSAPLAATLLYLAERGNPLFGALSLFFLAVGMSIPLLLIASGFGYLLPSGGPWLNKIKTLFAMLLFALAVFILSPLLPAVAEVFIFLYCFLIVVAVGTFLLSLRLTLVLAYVFALAAGGGYHLLSKMATATAAQDARFARFIEVSDYASFTAELQDAGTQERPALIYYSAEWCVSCKELDWAVFNNKHTVQELSEVTLIKADITHNNADSRQMLAHFDVLGPPSIYFLDKEGSFRPEMTLVGYFSRQTLSAYLGKLNN